MSISRNGTERNKTERRTKLRNGQLYTIYNIIRTDARPTDSGTTPSRTQAQFPRIVAYMYYMCYKCILTYAHAHTSWPKTFADVEAK